MPNPTTSTSTSTTTSTSTSTSTTLWFNPADYEEFTGDTYTASANSFYALVDDIGAHIEDVTGVVFNSRDITEEIIAHYIPYARVSEDFVPREFSASNIALRVRCTKRPVNSVTSISTKEKGETDSLTMTYMDLRESVGMVYIPTTTGKIGESVIVEIVYNAGYSSPPSRVKRALALLVREWLLAQERVVGGAEGWITQFKIGDYSERRELLRRGQEPRIGLGTLLSRRAEQLLKPWLGRRTRLY